MFLTFIKVIFFIKCIIYRLFSNNFIVKRMKGIIKRSYENPNSLSDDDIIQLLSIDCFGNDFYELISASNKLTRKSFNNRAYVFMQIGLNAEPCSGGCKFCSFGDNNFSVENRWHKTKNEIIEAVQSAVKEGVDDIFLMTTADYSFDEYISVVEAVKPLLKEDMRLVANIGDFSISDAQKLKNIGITGVYHVNRLREGVDTAIDPELRAKTLDIIRDADLELYYCIEPIGKEHSYEEILVEIRRAQHLCPDVMAVMRRVGVENTPMWDRESVTAIELTKIAAVTNLIVRPKRAMNLHETEQMSLLAGINQLYAECGSNPRDNDCETEKNRGLSVCRAKELFRDSGYICKKYIYTYETLCMAKS